MKHSGRRTQSELHLQSQIIANMGEGVYLIRSADGIIVYCNPKFEKMFGYEPDEMVGQHVSIVNAPDQGDPQETVRAIVTQLQTRGYWNGELLNIKKDGTTF
ncbi:MAG: PAS domain-containing protein, partial [Candidatus Marinimicrobia bacterium]|nr:PAS domain-containing protein [Candidatus Neomarinimicrobiota bacterium]